MSTQTAKETTAKPGVDWQALTDEYARGASDVEIARLLGITITKFYQVYEQNKAFADFVDAGRTLAQAWWYHAGRSNLMTKGFNVSLYNFIMKNRFGWADKVEAADTTDKDNLDLNDLKTKVAIQLKKLAETSPEVLSSVKLLSQHLPKDEND